jgi:hypothetical protein
VACGVSHEQVTSLAAVADDTLSVPTLNHVEHIDGEGVRVGSLAR